MEKITYKEEKVVVKEVATRKVYCDCCNNHIATYSDNDDKLQGIHSFRITTGHRDWGTDSVDSVETKVVCSNECLMKLLATYLIKEPSDSRYFDIESVVY